MGLPRPCGLFCFGDWLANLALRALRLAGLVVPEEVAVVGMGNDEILCESSELPLTSVDPHLQRVGRLAAEAAIEAVERGGGPAPGACTRVEPRGVVARSSSHAVAATDPHVASAIHYLLDAVVQEKYPDAEEIAGAIGLSRRYLDERFQATLGRTVAAEISRRRVQAILQFLRDGELPLVDIAIRSGCGSVSQVCRLVRLETGLTPMAYRRQIG